MDIDWTRLLTPDVPLLEIVLRGTAIYLGIFFLLRILRRPTGQLGIADVLLIAMLADASQNAMGGGYESLTSGVVLVLTIIGWDQVIDRLSFRSRRIAHLTTPQPLQLICDGHILWKNLEKVALSSDDLMSHLRQNGVDDPARVRQCLLEGDGSISVLRNEQGAS